MNKFIQLIISLLLLAGCNSPTPSNIASGSENILKAVRSIRKKQKIMLKGFLVNIADTYEGGNVWWNSSISRKDTDNSSCEVF